MTFDVPAGVNIEEACAEWLRTGGQVRTFGNGGDVPMKAYPIADWLVIQKGARRVFEGGQPATAE